MQSTVNHTLSFIIGVRENHFDDIIHRGSFTNLSMLFKLGKNALRSSNGFEYR